MTCIDEILHGFIDKVDCIVDGGKSKIGIPSTIIKIENENIKILRDGPISKQDLERRLEKC